MPVAEQPNSFGTSDPLEYSHGMGHGFGWAKVNAVGDGVLSAVPDLVSEGRE